MKNQLLIFLVLIFALIFASFFYLLKIERNPSEIQSNLLDKNVPSFEAKSLFENKKFISPDEFINEVVLVNFLQRGVIPV